MLFNHHLLTLQPEGRFGKEQMKLNVRAPHCMDPFQGFMHGFEFVIAYSFSYKESQIVKQKATHNLNSFLPQYIKNWLLI